MLLKYTRARASTWLKVGSHTTARVWTLLMPCLRMNGGDYCCFLSHMGQKGINKQAIKSMSCLVEPCFNLALEKETYFCGVSTSTGR